MKAVTLYQPWATLVAIGAKKIETRSWFTRYRGPLAIHAGKDKRFIDHRSPYYLCNEQPFYNILMEHAALVAQRYISPLEISEHLMPRGAIIAICELADCRQIPKPGYHTLDGSSLWVPPNQDTNEFHFGDYTPGRWAWILNNVQALPDPVPARGSLGLWEWQNDLPLMAI